MVQDRVERGRWAQHSRRLRNLTALVLAAVIASAFAGSALGASGGGALGTKTPPKKSKDHNSSAGNPLARRGMWIWELPYVDGGSVPSIIAGAHRYGVGTLMIKSSDGTSFWTSQFTRQLVNTLHAAGIKVCAWQYVYGNHPITEAYMGADAVHDGADCLIIDAETEYEGKYVAAQAYMQRLRKLIGNGYPVALAGFPYIDFHPAFPYSVFLGPGGAQYNVPQMYWKDIGTTTDAVFAHTYTYNLIYQRPIFPLGQVYSSPPPHQIFRFRQLSRVYGASNVSWWDWQEASAVGWNAISRPAGHLGGYVADKLMASIGRGATGDLVVWTQEHLITAGDPVAVDGNFGAAVQTAVQSFQSDHGLMADGIIGPETWGALLRYRPATVVWTNRGARVANAAMARTRGVYLEPVPRSASRRARRNEIAGAPGRGGTPGP
jgi:peptidoglycan hydrolase-like protein with peptidoglycan-binding domain